MARVRLRLQHHVGASTTFVGRQTDVEDKRIAAKTANVILSNVNTFFRWAVSDGYRNDNPADGIKIIAPKAKKGEKPRLPFQCT